MVRTQVYLPEELEKELKLIAKSEGVNYSSLIREGVKEVILKRKFKKHSKYFLHDLVGAYKGKGPKEVASKVNDIYKKF